MPGASGKFYTTFTTAMNGLMGSAICIFTADDIQAAFNGKFKEQATSSSAWLPVHTNRVPEPRPGVCVNDTETLPGTKIQSNSKSVSKSVRLGICIKSSFNRHPTRLVSEEVKIRPERALIKVLINLYRIMVVLGIVVG